MTVSTDFSRVSYAGAGTVGPFTIPFYFLADGDLTVIKTVIATGVEEELALTTDYTVTGAGDENGGGLTLAAILAATYTITIINDPAATQGIRYPENDKFPAKTHERGLDRLTMLVQRALDLGLRSLRLSDGHVGNIDLAVPEPIASAYWRWNNTATAVEFVNAVYALGQYLSSAPGAIARDASAKMSDIFSADDVATVQQALDEMDQGGSAFFPKKVRTVALPLTWPIDSVGGILEGEGGGNVATLGSVIKFVGPVGPDAFLTAEAPAGAGFVQDTIRDISLSANGQLRYVLHFNTAAGATTVNKHWDARRLELADPSLSAILIGQDTWTGADFTAATQDADCAMNVFDHIVFQHRAGQKYDIVYNISDNGYQQVLRDSSVEGSAGQRADVINYIRQIQGQGLLLENCFFSSISVNDTLGNPKANAAVVRARGGVSMFHVYTEEGRLLIRENGPLPNGIGYLACCSINAPNKVVGTNDRVVVDSGSQPLVMLASLLGTTAAPRSVHSTSAPVHSVGVDLGTKGFWKLGKPLASSIDGVRIGQANSLIHNWNLCEWIETTDEIAIPQGMARFAGLGGVFKSYVENTVRRAGKTSLYLNITTQATTFISGGVVVTFPDDRHVKDTLCVVMTGWVKNPAFQPIIYITDGQIPALGNTTIFVDPAVDPDFAGWYQFTAVANALPTATFSVYAGTAANGGVGEMVIDTLVAVNSDGTVTPANAALAFSRAATVQSPRPLFTGLTLLNAYTAVGTYGTPSASLNGNRTVSLLGKVTGGTNDVIATLPIGMRPGQNYDLTTTSNGAASAIKVGTNGDLTVIFGGRTNVSLSGITFPL